ncbi:hypothetical protein GVAV_000868 [Gurleya vavrai]
MLYFFSIQIFLVHQLYATPNTENLTGFKLKIEPSGNKNPEYSKNIEFVFDANLDDTFRQNIISILKQIHTKDSEKSVIYKMGPAYAIRINGDDSCDIKSNSIPEEIIKNKTEYKLCAFKVPEENKIYMVIIKDIPEKKIQDLYAYLGKFKKESTDILDENLPKVDLHLINISGFETE